MMKFIFEMQINIKIFYKLILSFWVCVTRHAQGTQKKMFEKSMFQKSMGDEVYFLPADKHKSFLQVDSITLSVHSHAMPKVPKTTSLQIFAISQGKREG